MPLITYSGSYPMWLVFLAARGIRQLNIQNQLAVGGWAVISWLA